MLTVYNASVTMKASMTYIFKPRYTPRINPHIGSLFSQRYDLISARLSRQIDINYTGMQSRPGIVPFFWATVFALISSIVELRWVNRYLIVGCWFTLLWMYICINRTGTILCEGFMRCLRTTEREMIWHGLFRNIYVLRKIIPWKTGIYIVSKYTI